MARAKHGKNNNRNNNQVRNRKNNEKHFGNTDFDDLSKQLKRIGLTVKEMQGDGNCLFRALGDQMEGHSNNHIQLRLKVAEYIKLNRTDFEPFIEDDVPFDDHVKDLSEPGTYGGNDSIVAFSRLHNVSIVIHQHDSPAWVIHPKEPPDENLKQLHISYHNGDHYNSVVKVTETNATLVTSTVTIALQTETVTVETSSKTQVTKGKQKQKSTSKAQSSSLTEAPSDVNATSTCDANASEPSKSTKAPGKPTKQKLSRRQQLDQRKKDRKAENMERKRAGSGTEVNKLTSSLESFTISDVPLKTLTI